MAEATRVQADRAPLAYKSRKAGTECRRWFSSWRLHAACRSREARGIGVKTWRTPTSGRPPWSSCYRHCGDPGPWRNRFKQAEERICGKMFACFRCNEAHNHPSDEDIKAFNREIPRSLLRGYLVKGRA